MQRMTDCAVHASRAQCKAGCTQQRFVSLTCRACDTSLTPHSHRGHLSRVRARVLPAWIAPALAGLVPFVASLAALSRGLPGGDSGELIAVAATGGVAH